MPDAAANNISATATVKFCKRRWAPSFTTCDSGTGLTTAWWQSWN